MHLFSTRTIPIPPNIPNPHNHLLLGIFPSKSTIRLPCPPPNRRKYPYLGWKNPKG